MQFMIDKTQPAEKLLETSRGVCLCGMPGIGKKTMIRMLLEKHPEVLPRICTLDFPAPLSPDERKGRVCTWYILRKNCMGESKLGEKLGRFLAGMSREDRVLMVTDGEIPEDLLEYVWNGSMSLVYPDSFWFTKAETFRYLRAHRSSLDREWMYRFTRGWAGCLALMVRIQQQLPDAWTPDELYSRYEIHQFVREKILKKLPEEERKLLEDRSAFPWLNRELVDLLWEDPQKETEERLFMRGIMLFHPDQSSWYVHPVIRRTVGMHVEPEKSRRALQWYGENNLVRAAMECCWNLGNREEFINWMIRNFDRISYLPFAVSSIVEKNSIAVPELFFLKWMDIYFDQDYTRLGWYTEQAEKFLREAERTGKNSDRWREVFLNITYFSPDISLRQWMQYLESHTEPERPLRLYYTLGESVSFLSGIRDLTELFACTPEERSRFERLWRERLSQKDQMVYRLAKIEYAFLTDRIKTVGNEVRDVMDEIGLKSPWQLRMGKLYLLFLFSEGGRISSAERRVCSELMNSFQREENDVCRYNGMALYYLTEARWGEKEDIIRWIKETGGDIANKEGKTQIHLAAQVKVQMYLGNYPQAGRLLDESIPFFEKNHIWKFLAEALFQKAVCEREQGRNTEAMKWMAESFQTAEPYRYVRIYTGYGKKGRELLETYRSMIEQQDVHFSHGKRPYKYGNVRNMPYMDWIDYVIRKAKRNEPHISTGTGGSGEEFRTEKLTPTEIMVLQYINSGYKNKEISEKLNVKLSTVKTHIYLIYRKLGVSNRVQAVQRGKEEGIL